MALAMFFFDCYFIVYGHINFNLSKPLSLFITLRSFLKYFHDDRKSFNMFTFL